MNVEINDDLVKAIKKAVKIKNNEKAIQMALNDFLKIEKQRELLKLAGKVKWDGDLDEMRKMRF